MSFAEWAHILSLNGEKNTFVSVGPNVATK